MSISFVNGQMLNSNLQRGTANLAVQTNLLYIDVVNNRIGIKTSTPTVELDVNGNIKGNNLTADTATIPSFNTVSNGNITITPNGTGIVKIVGTNGLEIPYGNTTQRPGSPDTGTLRLNTELDQLEIWDGTQWLTGSGGGSGNVTIADQQFNGDGSTTNFSLSQTATQASILVTLNGLGQIPGVAYTVSGTTLSFTQAPAQYDVVDVRFLAGAVAPGTLYNTSGNSAVYVTDTPQIIFKVATANVATIDSTHVVNISTAHSLQLPSYTVVQATGLSNVATGQLIYVSNGTLSGTPCLAVYNGTAWKQIALGNTIGS